MHSVLVNRLSLGTMLLCPTTLIFSIFSAVVILTSWLSVLFEGSDVVYWREEGYDKNEQTYLYSVPH